MNFKSLLRKRNRTVTKLIFIPDCLHDSLHQRLENEKIEKLEMYKIMLERIMLFLRLNKQEIQLIHKDKLVSIEKNIIKFLSYNLARSKTSSPQQGQLHQYSMHLQNTQSLIVKLIHRCSSYMVLWRRCTDYLTILIIPYLAFR